MAQGDGRAGDDPQEAVTDAKGLSKSEYRRLAVQAPEQLYGKIVQLEKENATLVERLTVCERLLGEYLDSVEQYVQETGRTLEHDSLTAQARKFLEGKR